MTNSVVMLRKGSVREKYGRSISTMYSDISKGVFVPPVALGKRCSAWPEHEVDAVLAARIAGKSDNEIRQLVNKLVAARFQAA